MTGRRAMALAPSQLPGDAPMTHVLQGGCHCGNIGISYRTGVSPAATRVRACQCSFCRKHAARAVSDPEGHAEITVRDLRSLHRYRFALATAEFFICKICGVYVAAVMTEADQTFATLIINALDAPERFTQPATPVDYAAEDTTARRRRRRTRWTPTTVRIEGA